MNIRLTPSAKYWAADGVFKFYLVDTAADHGACKYFSSKTKDLEQDCEFGWFENAITAMNMAKEAGFEVIDAMYVDSLPIYIMNPQIKG